MRKLITLLSFMGLLACTNKPIPQVKLYKTGSFILADTIDTPPLNWQTSDKPGGYPIYYWGPVKDTVAIGKKYNRKRTAVPKWPRYFTASRTFAATHLQIEVDTTISTDNSVEYFAEDGSFDDDAAEHYRSKLVTIRNISDSIIWLGSFFAIEHMYLECKNRHGQWVAVQKKLANYGLCRNGEPDIYLKPGHIIITKSTHLQGSFATDCRLVLARGDWHCYSNTFRQAINDTLLNGIQED